MSSLVVFVIKIYKKVLSPIIPRSCRFQPTCSQYMIDAIYEWGLLKGMWLGCRRVIKCHPWGKHGYDPVPKKD